MKNKRSLLPAVLSALCILAVGVGSFAAIRRSTQAAPGQESVSRITVEWEQTEKETEALQVNEPVSGVFGRRDAETTVPVTSSAPAATAASLPDCVLPFGTDMVKDYSDGKPVFQSTLMDWRVHNGVDFGGRAGDGVKAAKKGTVTDVVTDEEWGTAVEIAVSSTVTLRYCGLAEKTAVAKGDSVEAGEVIGSLGTVPCESADGSHLHFEVKENGEYTDPLTFLNRSGAAD